MELEATPFTELLMEANGIDPDQFVCWIFHPGMLFGSSHKWWGDGGLRDFPHEGIDFCLYQDSSGNLNRLGPETRIPVLHDGVVRWVFTDYLGQTLLAEHEPSPSEAGKRISFYAHIRPLNGIKPGVRLKQGDPLATIADTRRSKARILPHLHYSLGAASAGLVYDGFVWNHMRNPDWVKLLDPLPLLDWRHRIVDQRESDLGALSHVTRQ